MLSLDLLLTLGLACQDQCTSLVGSSAAQHTRVHAAPIIQSDISPTESKQIVQIWWPRLSKQPHFFCCIFRGLYEALEPLASRPSEQTVNPLSISSESPEDRLGCPLPRRSGRTPSHSHHPFHFTP